MELAQRPSHSALVMEDDAVLASTLRDFLKEEGWAVECAGTVEEARSMLTRFAFDLVLADYVLPDADGMTVFHEIQSRSPLTRILMMTGTNSPDLASLARQKGAADFIFKPFKIQDLECRIRKLMMALRPASDDADEALESNFRPAEIVGKSPAIRHLFGLIERIAPTSATVLITGESGTGKELVARSLHRQSERAHGPFVAINCGAIPEQLLEDELFGHVKGAYTDARQERMGKFQQADEGTLFLDEIGTMPMSLQAKLLRIVESRELEKLGSSDTIKIDIRIIAATNANLAEKVEAGEFREDLFYRFNVVPVKLPPLRRRKGDISLLMEHFLQVFCREYELPPKKLCAATTRQLLRYPWPGNVRELRNAVEFATVLSGDRRTLTFEDFPALVNEIESDSSSLLRQLDLPDEGVDLGEMITRMERDLITQSLARADGNKGKAARLLGLKRTTLVEKLRRMEML